MTKFEDYSCFGSTRSPLQPYVSCHECLQQSRFWVPGCDPCLPAICDHLSWATIFACPTGWSLYTGFTVSQKKIPNLVAKILAIKFGSQNLAIKFGSQNFGYQICFSTRLISYINRQNLAGVDLNPFGKTVLTVHPLDRWTSGFSLTLKHRETHGCVVSTVATDALC